MERHRWTVGLLSEMAPAGKVGLDPVCVLGVNKNQGEREAGLAAESRCLGYDPCCAAACIVRPPPA